MISEDIKYYIKLYNRLGEYDAAYNMLCNLLKITDKMTDRERFFVYYELAWTSKKMGNIQEAKEYAIMAKGLFYGSEYYLTEQLKAQWLFVEIIKDSFEYEELKIEYEKLLKLFKILKGEESEEYIGIKASILFLDLEENRDLLLMLKIKCIKYGYIETAQNISKGLKDTNLINYSACDSNKLLSSSYCSAVILSLK